MNETLSNWMLHTARELVIKNKGLLENAIILYAAILPEPTLENTLEPNSHVLLKKRDIFFSYYTNPSKQKLYHASWKILISEVEHDPDHRSLFFWLTEEIVESTLNGEWKPRPVGMPSGYWNEPRTIEGNYGGYRGRKFKQYIKEVI